MDHTTPWSLGGCTDLANLALCCPFHNRFKNRHPDLVEITQGPNVRPTYRIAGQPGGRRTRRSRRRRWWARDPDPRDGPTEHAA